MPNQLELDISDEMHPLTIKKRAHREAASAAAEDDAARRAAMKQRHLAEWDEHADLWYDALFKRSEPLAKLAKTLAETLRIRQSGEHVAWIDQGHAKELDEETCLRDILGIFEQYPSVRKKIIDAANRKDS